MVSVLLIDNYDSFVYNIAQYLGEKGAEVRVERNDSTRIDEYCQEVDGFVISPGPGHPKDSGKSLEVIKAEGYHRPVLGICLGHQAIAYSFGGRIGRARRLVHGKVTRIHHDGEGLLEGVPSPFMATRYHSLIVEKEGLPSSLHVGAFSDEQEIMSLRAKDKEIFGLQFHPESVMTSQGKTILSNFLGRCRS